MHGFTGKGGKIAFTIAFILFVLFLYGPLGTMMYLSFQDQYGGVTLPFTGPTLYWYKAMIEQADVGDLKGAVRRSLILAVIVMLVTMVLSTSLAQAFRKQWRGQSFVFYLIMGGLMVPGILISLGLILLLKYVDLDAHWYSTGLGVHVIWTLPFGFLLMLAVFNRFDTSVEEAARDLGASNWEVFRKITLPIIAPGVLGAALFGFTLSYDEFSRTLLVAGPYNTLPLDVFSTLSDRVRPTLYALGTATTIFSLIIVLVFLAVAKYLSERARGGRVG